MQEKIARQINFIIQLSTQKIQEAKLLCKGKIDAVWQQLLVKLQILLAVAKLQFAMLRVRADRKMSAARQFISAKWRELYEKMRWHMQAAIDRADAYARDYSARLQQRYALWRKMWHYNQNFTFWLIPADGSHIAKTHVKKTHLKYAFSGVAALVVIVSVTIGVLAHFAIRNEAQMREIAEYKATKQAQEQTIQELQKIAEKNQKQLAYLSKLEDKVRKEMAKNGAELPPKSDASVYAGKGGPALGDSTPMGYMLEQEKNIHNEAKAKKADFEKLLTAIENENYRRLRQRLASRY